MSNTDVECFERHGRSLARIGERLLQVVATRLWIGGQRGPVPLGCGVVGLGSVGDACLALSFPSARRGGCSEYQLERGESSPSLDFECNAFRPTLEDKHQEVP